MFAGGSSQTIAFSYIYFVLFVFYSVHHKWPCYPIGLDHNLGDFGSEHDKLVSE